MAEPAVRGVTPLLIVAAADFGTGGLKRVAWVLTGRDGPAARNVGACVCRMMLAKALLASSRRFCPPREGLVVERLVLCCPAEGAGSRCLTPIQAVVGDPRMALELSGAMHDAAQIHHKVRAPRRVSGA